MGKRGGKREGAGRKPKADEVKLIEKMDAVLAPVKVWEALAEKVQEKDSQAIKTWLNYRYGMPKQTVNQSGRIEVKNVVLDQSDIEQLTRLDDV